MDRAWRRWLRTCLRLARALGDEEAVAECARVVTANAGPVVASPVVEFAASTLVASLSHRLRTNETGTTEVRLP